MKVYTPPEYPDLTNLIPVFLGGSIEMGKAHDWQSDFIQAASHIVDRSEYKSRSVVILNPRRPDWNPNLEQDISNPYFNQQVNWELDYLERAKYRVFYFTENTISPITLMELAKFGNQERTYVCYDPNYLRKGNVQIFCHRYGIPTYPNIQIIVNKIFKPTVI